MTEMKRITICIPDELEKEIVRLRMTEEFCRCSFSEIVRQLVSIGIKKNREAKGKT